MMQTKRSLVWPVLAVSLFARLAGADAHAASDLPHSLTGDVLGGIVSMQRNDIASADRALYAAVTHGLNDPGFNAMAMRYAAMDGGKDAASRAAELALRLPHENLARLISGNAALRQKNWVEARRLFTPVGGTGDFIAIAGPALRAWSLYGAGQGAKAVPMLLHEPRRDVMGWLNVVQAARLAAALGDPQAATLFAQVRTRLDAAPPILRFMVTRDEAGWLLAHGKRAEADRIVHDLGRDVPAFRLVASRFRPQAMTPPDATEAVSDFYVALAGLLGQPPSRDRSGTDDHAKGEDDSTSTADREMRQFTILILRQSLWLRPDSTLAKIMLGEALRFDKQLDAAQEVLGGVSPNDPLAPLAEHARAQIAIQRHDLPAALQALERVAQADPDNPDVLNELAIVQDQLGHSADAVATFTHALDNVSVMEARSWPLLLGRAIAYDHLHHRDKAQADLDRALALAPREPVLLNYAGYSDVEHGERPQQALELLKRAVAIAPDDAEIRDSYAWALLKQNGDLARAVPMLLSAVSASPGDAEIAYHLGVAYWYQGRQLEARDQWNQALNDKPEPETRALIEAALAHGPDLPVMRGHSIPSAR